MCHVYITHLPCVNADETETFTTVVIVTKRLTEVIMKIAVYCTYCSSCNNDAFYNKLAVSVL